MRTVTLQDYKRRMLRVLVHIQQHLDDPLGLEELARLAQPVTIDHQAAQLYEQAGENPGSGGKSRILAAVTRREGVAWFFKMTGDDELVAQQKPAFIEFLQSVAFPSHAP